MTVGAALEDLIHFRNCQELRKLDRQAARRISA